MGIIHPPPIGKLPLKLPFGLSGKSEIEKKDKKNQEQLYLTLLLDVQSVAASVWKIGKKKEALMLASGIASVPEDTWESRIEASDALISHLEEKTNTTSVDTVVLGLPPTYLSETGEVLKEYRVSIKQLTNELVLKAVGFVSITQALLFQYKRSEGVPPSVILIGISQKTYTITVYKVGIAVIYETYDSAMGLSEALESCISTHTEVEVFPSRIRIYGGSDESVSDAKNVLLKYSWGTKSAFLHYPKIEIASVENVIEAVSIAGASELAKDVAMDDEEPQVEEEQALADQSLSAEGNALSQGDEQKITNGDDDLVVTAEANGSLPTVEHSQDFSNKESEEVEPPAREETTNFSPVDPEKIGFHTKYTKDEDEIEIQKLHDEEMNDDQADELTDVHTDDTRVKKSAFRVPTFHLPRLPFSPKVAAIIGVALLFVGVLVSLLFFILPRAEITIMRESKNIAVNSGVRFDAKVTDVDVQEGIVPLVTKQASMSGEKSVAATGKKKIGDPARGSVVILNKSLTGKTLKKGTILSVKSLNFTLDSEVFVASASENLISGTVTFGRANANITASAIGTSGNLDANTEFTVKDVPSSVLVARNEESLKGGSSKDIVVVSRADYDAIVKVVTDEATTQASDTLSASLGGLVLIPSSVKIAVSNKKFSAEIDEETKTVSGSIQLTVTGLAYSKEHMSSIASFAAKDLLPQDFVILPEKTEVNVDKLVIKKDGSVIATMSSVLVALPKIDTAKLPNLLTGKTKKDAAIVIKAISGVKDVSIRIMSILSDRLPFDAKKILIKVSDD